MNREINANIYIENIKNAYLRSQPTLPNTIPSIRGFVGREVYLKSLHKSYRKKTQCFVLHGIGGGGKTALALEFANEIAGDFEAKILVRMQGMSKTPYSSRDAMFEIVRQFEPEVSAAISDNELKSKFIQLVQNQRTLIVLDGAENKQSVESLIEADACFITTSREFFVLSGGKSIKLHKMLPADARRLLVGIAGRKRLNGQAGKLAELAGYLPMALKPLASILGEDELETATNLVDKYSKKLSDLLKERVPEYENLTIQASFELSYEKLLAELAERWRRLSVFPADFDEAAMASILGVSEDTAHETQKQLRRYSLLEVNPETKRFHLHDLARVFTNEKLSEDERFKTCFLFARYYASLLIRMHEMQSKREENYYSNALKLLDTEWHNITAGQKWAAEFGKKDDRVAEFGTVYSDYAHDFLRLRLHPDEDIAWLNSGLAATRKLNLRQSETNVLNSLGLAHKNQGDNRKAAAFFEKALKISREIGYPLGIGNTLNNLGTTYNSLGEYQKAINCYRQSLVISRELENKLGESNTLNNLGLTYANKGDYPKAIEYYEQSLEIKHKIGNTLGEGNTLNALGTAYKQIGENQRAIECFERALKIARELGNKLGEASSLNSLGLIYTIQGNYRKAINCHEQALKVAQEMNNRLTESNTLNNLGLAYKNLGEYEKAIDHHQKALEIKCELGHKQSECNTLNNLGSAYKGLGNHIMAIEKHQKAYEISCQIGYRLGESNSLSNLGTAYANLGEFKIAAEYQEMALEISRDINNRLVESYCLSNLGKAYVNLREYKKAIEYLTKALELSRQMGEQLVEGHSLGYLGIAYYGLKKKEKAFNFLKNATHILKEIESPEVNIFQQFIEKNY
jgi:tetratricopeptide (TPR) repeat protein